MITYQDYLNNNKDVIEFIQDTINDFKASNRYRTGVEAEQYYLGNNIAILEKRNMFVTKEGLQEDTVSPNNKFMNKIYPKIIDQANYYLLKHGVELGNNKIKEGLGGKKFDVKLQSVGVDAWNHGVGWAYCFVDKKGKFNVDMWNGLEFIPLFDESNNLLRAGIRFWQITGDKPLYVEFYEEDGVSKYVIDKKNKNSQSLGKKPYRIIRSTDALEETIIGESNWSMLPIIPLYNNLKSKASAFDNTIKCGTDLLDVFVSDFGNNLEAAQDIYWVLKNYQGQDLGAFLSDLKYYKSIKVQGDGSAEAHTVDVPWQARKEAIEIVRKLIYDYAMAADITNVRNGSNATTVEIEAVFYDLDRKTDKFENATTDFIDGIVSLYLEYINSENLEYEIKFYRDKLSNKTDELDRIYTAREDLPRRKVLELVAPILGFRQDEVQTLMDEIDEEAMRKAVVEEEGENNIENIENNLTDTQK